MPNNLIDGQAGAVIMGLAQRQNQLLGHCKAARRIRRTGWALSYHGRCAEKAGLIRWPLAWLGHCCCLDVGGRGSIDALFAGLQRRLRQYRLHRARHRVFLTRNELRGRYV